MTKKEARIAANAAFDAWYAADPKRPEVSSRIIYERLEASREFRNSSTILVYMSIRGEVLTNEFIEKWYPHKRFVLPLVKGNILTLKLYDPKRLTKGYRSIVEPTDDATDINPSDIDLAIVPGAAFEIKDNAVLRLGRGGGFYDRLLPHLKCPTIGVCYSCRITEDLPTDPWDRPLDILISDN